MSIKDNAVAINKNNQAEMARQDVRQQNAKQAEQLAQKEKLDRAAIHIAESFRRVFDVDVDGKEFFEALWSKYKADSFESRPSTSSLARIGELSVLEDIVHFAEKARFKLSRFKTYKGNPSFFGSEDGQTVLTVLKRDFRYAYPDLPSTLDIESQYKLSSRFGELRVLYTIARLSGKIDHKDISNDYNNLIDRLGGA